VDVLQRGQADGAGGGSLTRHVGDLPRGDSADSSCAPELQDGSERAVRGDAGAGACTGDVLERERQERVAREQRRGLAERDVVGGSAAAERVVVHARHVVVDERRGVHHLDGAGHRDGRRRGTAHELARGDRQRGAEALAAREDGVAHGLAQDLGAPKALQGKVQRVVHGPGVGGQVALDVEGGGAGDDGDVDGGGSGSMVRSTPGHGNGSSVKQLQ